jgi:hypothetical protein
MPYFGKSGRYQPQPDLQTTTQHLTKRYVHFLDACRRRRRHHQADIGK